MFRAFVFAAIVVVALQGCTRKQIDLKSPCVGAPDSPCDRRPANEWLQQV